MEVKIDQTSCQQTGFCVRVAPTVFAFTDGRVNVVTPHPSPELHEDVEEAERLCPATAITIEW